jgi:hypothetical protein
VFANTIRVQRLFGYSGIEVCSVSVNRQGFVLSRLPHKARLRIRTLQVPANLDSRWISGCGIKIEFSGTTEKVSDSFLFELSIGARALAF